MDDFRRFFLRGLAALIPTLLTFAILVWAYKFVDKNVGTLITQGLLALCQALSDEPAPGFVDAEEDPLEYGTPINEWNDRGERLTIEYKAIHHKALKQVAPSASGKPDKTLRRAIAAKNRAMWEIAFRKYHLHLLGFLIAIILVYFTGFFLASFIGRASWRAAEGLLVRIPLIRAIYANVKQVTDFLLSESKIEFSGVVAIEYPRKGIWSLALKTGSAMEQVQHRYGDDEWITVFVPSSPTPVTGYVVHVPRKEVLELNITIDEALRFTISGGVIKPGVAMRGLESKSPNN